jgi:predicted RNase H-like HicB family nuclease
MSPAYWPGHVTIAGNLSAELPPGTERSILRPPDLPGCVALRDTEEDVIAEMRQAIRPHIAGLREDGQPTSQPTTVAATVITLDAA